MARANPPTILYLVEPQESAGVSGKSINVLALHASPW